MNSISNSLIFDCVVIYDNYFVDDSDENNFSSCNTPPPERSNTQTVRYGDCNCQCNCYTSEHYKTLAPTKKRGVNQTGEHCRHFAGCHLSFTSCH